MRPRGGVTLSVADHAFEPAEGDGTVLTPTSGLLVGTARRWR